MSAQALSFPEWIQEPMEAGHLSPQSAWELEWEYLALQGRPWTPGVFEMSQRVGLYHWQPEQMND